MSEPANTSTVHERSAQLIERMLGDPELRRRFRAEPGAVLREVGLAELAGGLGSGEKALRTLELRESRSSLAGAMVAAAAEGVELAHFAEHAAPALGHDFGRMIDRLVRSLGRHSPVRHAGRAAKPGLQAGGQIPPLVASPHAAPAPGAAAAAAPGPAPAPAGAGGSAGAANQPIQLPTTDSAHAGPAHPGDAAHNHADHHKGAGVIAAEAHHRHLLRYPGDDASPQQIAAWMAAHAKRAGLPPELPVMAALTESGLRNLPYGDRDSVGFFQMRLSIWDIGPYQGFRNDPRLQLQWFIDHALAVREQDPALAQSRSSFGEWVADVEQPAAQFRDRYQLQLQSAQELLHGVNLDQVLSGAAPPATSVGQGALQVALHLEGTPYQWGGSSPATGFDCSGLVQYAYAQQGIELPRVAAEQFDVGIPVSRQDLQPGDAVFFADPTGYVHHVGLYIGDGRFIDAPRTGEDVRIDSLSDPYFAEQYVGARRYSAAAIGDPSTYARSLPTVESAPAPAQPGTTQPATAPAQPGTPAAPQSAPGPAQPGAPGPAQPGAPDPAQPGAPSPAQPGAPGSPG